MIDLIKFVYRGILTGMPLLTYNSITKNTFNVPMTVKPFSTYINFRLKPHQIDYLNNYIGEYSNLTLIPTKIRPELPEDYILSVNIYNCSSPVFLNEEKEITRCEINTYVSDNGTNGTLILDYTSNDLSMDPLNLVKRKENTVFEETESGMFQKLFCSSEKDGIYLRMDYTKYYSYYTNISDDLITHTDRVYYKNGIYDKIYYDSSLVNANVKTPYLHKDFRFSYKGFNFSKIHSLFYFTDEIRFIGGMWDNVF